MKTTLRIFRIIFKLLLLAYVTVVNFFFITVFYSLLLTIMRHICPGCVPGLFDEGLVPHLVPAIALYPLYPFSTESMDDAQEGRLQAIGRC